GLRAETGIEYDQCVRGILHFYTESAQLEGALATARLMSDLGCERIVKTPEEVVALEPALAHVRSQIVGGDYAPDDEAGDAYLFTQRLAELCEAREVSFLYNATVDRLDHDGDRITGIVLRRAGGLAQTMHANAYVVALGSYSPFLVKPLGINLLIYPVKG